MIRESEYDDWEAEEESFRKEIEPMTRAEWVKQARAECEKELEYYEQLRRRAEELWEEEEGKNEEIEEESFTAPCKYVELYSEEERKEEEEPIHKECTETIKTEESGFQWSYLSKFAVRLITAVIVSLAVITIDYFGLKSSLFDSDVVKTAIQKNDSMESMEDSVATFAKDKVMPIFQKSQ